VPAARPTTTTAPPVVTKPKGNKSVAPGKVKKSAAAGPAVSSAPAPTVTTSPLNGKGHGKKP
jgi:hypothetical protein